MKQRTEQGWKKQQGTGGWIQQFRSKEKALEVYDMGKMELIECGYRK